MNLCRYSIIYEPNHAFKWLRLKRIKKILDYTPIADDIIQSKYFTKFTKCNDISMFSIKSRIKNIGVIVINRWCSCHVINTVIVKNIKPIVPALLSAKQQQVTWQDICDPKHQFDEEQYLCRWGVFAYEELQRRYHRDLAKKY